MTTTIITRMTLEENDNSNTIQQDKEDDKKV